MLLLLFWFIIFGFAQNFPLKTTQVSRLIVSLLIYNLVLDYNDASPTANNRSIKDFYMKRNIISIRHFLRPKLPSVFENFEQY